MGDSGRSGERLESLARQLASGEISRRTALRRFGAVALGAAVAGPASLFSAESALGRCPRERRCNGQCCPKHSHCNRKGQCKCNSGYTKCSGKCFDLQTSSKHCGDCATACGTNETCVGGQCQACSAGQTRPCYTGPAGTEGVGPCHGGTQTCGSGGTWGPCQGEVTPQSELCNGIDDDCNGVIDNGFDIGAACTVGLGACQRTGVLICNPSGTGTMCSATAGAPSPEVCNGIDDNCNGIVDDNAPCPAGQSCISGSCQPT